MSGYGWDDKVDGSDNRGLMAEGYVNFYVSKLKRDRRQVGELGMRNVAVLTLEVQAAPQEGDDVEELPVVEIKEDLILDPKFGWKIAQFFTAIGQRKHGDKGEFLPNWSKVEKATGRAYNQHRTYEVKQGKNAGEKRITNQLRFLAEDEEFTPTVKSDAQEDREETQDEKPPKRGRFG